MWVVGGVTCTLYPDHMQMQVKQEGDASRLLFVVGIGGLTPGLRLTEYGGSMMHWAAELGENYVQFVSDVCYGPASSYTPDPCEIELLALDRGEVEVGGAGGAAVEIGSRVRMRIACPNGLYSPGADDYNASVRKIIPAEFELEARDCTLAEDTSMLGGAPGSGGAPVSMCGPDPRLEAVGPVVESSKVTEVPLPPPEGGPLVDGIYDATTQVSYGEFDLGTVTGEFRRAVRVRDGGAALDMFTLPIGGSPQSSTFSVVVLGSDLELTTVCPNTGGASVPLPLLPYTATAGQLNLYDDNGSTTTAIVTHVLRD